MLYHLRYGCHTSNGRGWGLPLTVLLLLGACGGKGTGGTRNPDEAQGGTATAVAGGGGTSVSGQGAGASAGGSQQGSACLEPVAPTGSSSCAFEGFAFDADAERCRYFSTARCEVTKNRFDTLEACVAACDPGGLDRCRVAADCTVRSAGCCRACEPAKREELRAIPIAYADVETCPDVACGACPPYDGEPERPYYGATCTNQRCELMDVRDTELGTCAADGDCRLRRGLECCECGGDGPWVAISNQPLAVANLLCGAPLACDQTCDRSPPEDLRASCVAGRCLISKVAP